MTTSSPPATSRPGCGPWRRRCATTPRWPCPAAAAPPAARRRSSCTSHPTRRPRWPRSLRSCSSPPPGGRRGTCCWATTRTGTARCSWPAAARSTSTVRGRAAPTTAASSPPPASTSMPRTTARRPSPARPPVAVHLPRGRRPPPPGRGRGRRPPGPGHQRDAAGRAGRRAPRGVPHLAEFSARQEAEDVAVDLLRLLHQHEVPDSVDHRRLGPGADQRRHAVQRLGVEGEQPVLRTVQVQDLLADRLPPRFALLLDHSRRHEPLRIEERAVVAEGGVEMGRLPHAVLGVGKVLPG